jgi:hypothetical protein
MGKITINPKSTKDKTLYSLRIKAPQKTSKGTKRRNRLLSFYSLRVGSAKANNKDDYKSFDIIISLWGENVIDFEHTCEE